jgi:sulfur carrier protein
MQLTINGKNEHIENAQALADVLQHLQLTADGVAIALNDTVVPRAKWESTPLRDGDHIEIIHAVQGG